MQAPSSAQFEAHRRSRGPRLFFPILLIVVGVVILLNNVGILPWSIWLSIGQLWPVVLILLGIEILVGRRNSWLGAVLAAVILIAVVVVATFMTFTGHTFTNSGTLQEQSFTQPLAGATQGNVNLTFPAGTVNVAALPANDSSLVRATAALPPGLTLSQQQGISDTTAESSISVQGSSRDIFPFGNSNGHGGVRLDALLSRHVPLTLRVEVGAGQSTFNLTDLAVQTFSLNAGAGQTTVYFPAAAGQTQAEINSGAGQLTLIIPPNVGAAIHTKVGIVNIHVPASRFQKTSAGYQSLNYGTSTNKVDITLHLGIGQVDVR